MRALVTGGTGFVGTAIVRELAAAGHKVRVLARNPSKAALNQPSGTDIIAGDIQNPPELAEALSGMDAVVHLVGIISETKKSTFLKVHVDGTRNVIAAATGAGVRRFIHISALGTRPNARSQYHQTKWAAEELVRHSGMVWTIFRPSLIYGPGDHLLNLFVRMARYSPILPLPGSPSAKYQPVHVSTVAHAFTTALVTPAAAGKNLDLCGPETFTLPEIVHIGLAAAGMKRWTPHVPRGLARLQAFLLEIICSKLLGIPAPLTRDQLTMLDEDNIGNCAEANTVLGLRQESFQTKVEDYLA